MGASTILHLQYLLSIDYFSHNKLIDEGKATNKETLREGHSDVFSTEFEIVTDEKLKDKSDYVASV